MPGGRDSRTTGADLLAWPPVQRCTFYTCLFTGKELYYTSIGLSESTLGDLGWWHDFLQLDPGNPSRSGSAGHLTVDWGDGSGTGTGGT
jgi:hypothetical protein